jgi:hypothetical protein
MSSFKKADRIVKKTVKSCDAEIVILEKSSVVLPASQLEKINIQSKAREWVQRDRKGSILVERTLALICM